MSRRFKLRVFTTALALSLGSAALFLSAEAKDPQPQAVVALRDWGPEQVIGEPNTPGAGDIVTAWASASQDNQKEWLICEYENFIKSREVHIYETYNPGAVYKVAALNDDDEEVVAWEGKDPTATNQPMGVSKIPLNVDFAFKKIKIYIDSPAVRGWNEIDAVGLRDAEGKLHWAKDVKASSTFAQPNAGAVVVRPRQALPEQTARIEKLENEVKELKEKLEELDELRAELKELRELLKARRDASEKAPTP